MDPPRTTRSSEAEGPPEAPEIDRRILMPAAHIAGVLMLSAIVLLAAFGVFGETRGATRGSGETVALAAEYPTRFRYKQINPIHLLVTNRSAATIDTLTVAFDTAYVARFSTVVFTPDPARAWEVELTGVRPGETRRIHVQLQGERYGRHRGTIQAFYPGSDTARVRLATVIFP